MKVLCDQHGCFLLQDTIILSAVVIACSLALLLYWWNK